MLEQEMVTRNCFHIILVTCAWYHFFYLYRLLNILYLITYIILHLKNRLIQMNLIFLLLILRTQLSTSFFYLFNRLYRRNKTVLKMFRYRANKTIESITECIGSTALSRCQYDSEYRNALDIFRYYLRLSGR